MKFDLCFNVTVAKENGVDVAVLTHHIAYWVFRNEANDTNIHDGVGWTFNTHKAYSELFPFWSSSQIRRIIDKAERQNVIETGRFNNRGYDRTKWYTLTAETRAIYQLTKTANATDENGNSKRRNRQMQMTESADLYQVTTTKKNTSNNTKEAELPLEFEKHEGFKHAWREWHADRKERRKPITQRAAKAQLKKLIEWSNGNPDEAIGIIHTAITNGWVGLFPPKQNRQRTGTSDGSELRRYIEGLT